MTISVPTRTRIENIYATYHHPDYLGTDPLIWVRSFYGAPNREIAGLVASALAYGRVAQILATLVRIREITGPDLLSFSRDTSLKEKRARLGHIRHRFNSGTDIALLLQAVGSITGNLGSLAALYLDSFNCARGNTREALCGFVDALRCSSGVSRRCATTFDYLLPSPSGGSACKRLNMYLRWMVRPDDGIDTGAWTGIASSALIMPVDTHISAIATCLGLTERKTADWRMAEEITASLKKIDPSDPVRYDFSLCRAGMFGLART